MEVQGIELIEVDCCLLWCSAYMLVKAQKNSLDESNIFQDNENWFLVLFTYRYLLHETLDGTMQKVDKGL